MRSKGDEMAWHRNKTIEEKLKTKRQTTKKKAK